MLHLLVCAWITIMCSGFIFGWFVGFVVGHRAGIKMGRPRA